MNKRTEKLLLMLGFIRQLREPCRLVRIVATLGSGFRVEGVGLGFRV